MLARRISKTDPDIRIGISGWRYAPWREKFYPAGLPQMSELHFASRAFNSVELNGSFYSLQRPERYRHWRQETPDDFVFSVKGGRYITHMKKLRDVETPLANFFASGVLELKEKLGPVLWQFPPFLPFSEERFAAFFDLLPKTTDEAVRLARHHDARVERFVPPTGHRGVIRHAIEVRHPSFLCEQFIALLRERDLCLVVADSAKNFPYFEDVTAPFVYVRLHGSTEIYSSGYSDSELEEWAKRVQSWAHGKQPRGAQRVSKKSPHRVAARDVYLYFDNDQKVEAPFNAGVLAKKLGLS